MGSGRLGRVRGLGRGGRALAAVAVVGVLATGCSTSGTEPGELLQRAPVWPAEEWEHASPVALGFDREVLEDVAAEAEAAGSVCLLVARHGRIAGEWYWRGTEPDDDHEVYSITKSVTSTLVGQVLGSQVEEPASNWIEAWRGTSADEVTVRDLLSNDSGRLRDLQTDYLGLIAAPNRTRYAIRLPQERPPGEAWAYNNSAIQTLERVVSAQTGRSAADLAEEQLFAPIGMAHTSMATDASGRTSMSFGMRSTCRDLARFGWLMASGGTWGDEQVVGRRWIEDATAPSTDLNASYGYLWWLNRKGRILDSPLDVAAEDDPDPMEGRLVPGAPARLFWALGLGDQILQVDPTTGTVVVRIGIGDTPIGEDDFTEADTARVVTEAVIA